MQDSRSFIKKAVIEDKIINYDCRTGLETIENPFASNEKYFRIQRIIKTTRMNNIFIIELLDMYNNITITNAYYNETDCSFIVERYNPLMIIANILINIEYRKYFSNHILYTGEYYNMYNEIKKLDKLETVDKDSSVDSIDKVSSVSRLPKKLPKIVNRLPIKSIKYEDDENEDNKYTSYIEDTDDYEEAKYNRYENYMLFGKKENSKYKKYILNENTSDDSCESVSICESCPDVEDHEGHISEEDNDEFDKMFAKTVIDLADIDEPEFINKKTVKRLTNCIIDHTNVDNEINTVDDTNINLHNISIQEHRQKIEPKITLGKIFHLEKREDNLYPYDDIHLDILELPFM